MPATIPASDTPLSPRRFRSRTRSGKPITDREITKLATEAEAGYDVDTLIARRDTRG